MCTQKCSLEVVTLYGDELLLVVLPPRKHSGMQLAFQKLLADSELGVIIGPEGTNPDALQKDFKKHSEK